jgi:hypothetical protein
MIQDNNWEDLIVTGDSNGRYHAYPDGTPAYDERFKFVWDFSEGLARAEDFKGNWFHIKPNGKPAYDKRYWWVGDFSGGLAWAENFEGFKFKKFKINKQGEKLENN